MQQKTYASPIFTSQILTDSYAVVIIPVPDHRTGRLYLRYGLYRISIQPLQGHNTGFRKAQNGSYRNTMQALSERNTDYRSVMNIVLF